MFIDRRSALKLLGALPALAAGQTPRKPNLVILLADDLGYGDIGCYGSPFVMTPHIDSIARNGVRFTDGYSSCAVCSPSRAALLSGQYQNRFGHEFNSGPRAREAEVDFGLPRGVRIAPDYLKAAGYRSMAIGKWHLGVRQGFHPLDRGFDEFFGYLEGGNDFVTKRTPGAHAVASNDWAGDVPEKRRDEILRGREVVQEDRYLTDAFGAEAVDFIERNRANPFFLYLAFNAVHTPLHATSRYMDRYAHVADERRRTLAAMASAMDDAAGAVLAKLREHGLERDTLVVFLSDNGCPVITGAGTNDPFNGEKCTYYEGGIRVAYAMQWPGRVPAGKVYSEPVTSRDLLPTLLAAAGVRANTRFDGVDLLPFVDGRRQEPPHEALFWRAGKARAVRKGKWKLVEFGDGYSKLYDLTADIGEKSDVSTANPAVVSELRAAWKAWSDTMAEPRWPARYRELEVNGHKLVWEL